MISRFLVLFVLVGIKFAQAEVPHEFRLDPTGGHGYGLHCDGYARVWPDDTLKWLRRVLPAIGK